MDTAPSPLFGYACAYLGCHLRQTDLALVDAQTKAEIGTSLINLFTNEALLSCWINTDIGWNERWLYNNVGIVAVMAWLKDLAISRGIQHENEEWLGSLLSSSAPEAIILKPAALVYGRRWLVEPGVSVKSDFSSVLALKTKVRK